MSNQEQSHGNKQGAGSDKQPPRQGQQDQKSGSERGGSSSGDRSKSDNRGGDASRSREPGQKGSNS
jgi:hypothetical protein